MTKVVTCSGARLRLGTVRGLGQGRGLMPKRGLELE